MRPKPHLVDPRRRYDTNTCGGLDGHGRSARRSAAAEDAGRSTIPPSTAGVGPDVTIEPLPGEVTTGFGPHSGKVMTAPRVFSIYWGRTYGSPATGINAKATTLDSLLATVVASRYVDNLAQYGVGAGTFIGSTWVDHSPGQAQTFTMDQIATILTAWLNACGPRRYPAPMSRTCCS